MANEEHLTELNEGVESWNYWRERNPDVRSDLSGADLRGTDLRRADLRRADLEDANLHGVDLEDADLYGANLRHADVQFGDLRHADLRRTQLGGTQLGGAQLGGANLEEAFFLRTMLSDLDLSETKGLEAAVHQGPSPISTSTLERSRGRIPAGFLKGCGLSDWEIENVKLFDPDLTSDEVGEITYKVHSLRTESPILVNPLFISYSHANTDFVQILEKRFDKKRIRYWRDVHDLKAGRMETQIEHAIQVNPTVLLVLSAASVESDWVVWEVKKARDLEKKLGRDVLCPIALDDAWKSSRWPERLRYQIEEYHIVDFSRWQEDEAVDEPFQKLLDGLKIFYPGKEPT